MGREIIARLRPGRISIALPWTVTGLLLTNSLRPLWHWPANMIDAGIWALSVATLVWIPFWALLKKSRTKGAAVWADAGLMHSLAWPEPIEVADIADVRISPPGKSLFELGGVVLLVLGDGRIREIAGGALTPSLNEIAERITNLPDRASIGR